MKFRPLLLLPVLMGVCFGEPSAKNWLFDFYALGATASGTVKSPEGQELGIFTYEAYGSYEKENSSYRLIIEQSQDGQYSESQGKKEWIWKKESDSKFLGTLLSAKKKEYARLQLHGDHIYSIETFIEGKLWTRETGILHKEVLFYSTVIHTEGMEHDFLLASTIAHQNQKVEPDGVDND